MMAPLSMGRRHLVVYLFVFLLGLSLGTAEVQTKKDRARNKERQAAKREHAESWKNICDIEDSSTGLYCYCDSLALQDAHIANCWIFNVTSPADTIWHSFQTQTKVQELRLNIRRDDGRLSFVPTAALQHLHSLELLEIANADIASIETDSFANLASLRNLSLKRNNINALQAGAFRGLVQLYDLQLSENQIGFIGRSEFSGLDELHVLLLDRNNISLLADESFAPLHQLVELDLSENHIPVLTSETFSGLDNLQILYLQDNQLSIIGDGTFTRVPHLRHLELQSNQIRIIRDGSFEGLTQLRYLNLQGNQLMELAERTWNPTPGLLHLNLKNNRLASLNQSTFKSIWSNLIGPSMFLTISGNSLACHCGLEWLERLHEATASETIKSSVESLTCHQDESQVVAVKEFLSSGNCQATTKTPARTGHRRKSTTVQQQAPVTTAPPAESVASTTATTSRPTFRYESVGVASHSLEDTHQLASSNSSKHVDSSSSSVSDRRINAIEWVAPLLLTVWSLRI